MPSDAWPIAEYLTCRYGRLLPLVLSAVPVSVAVVRRLDLARDLHDHALGLAHPLGGELCAPGRQ